MTAVTLGGAATRALSRTPGVRKERPFTDPVRKHSFHEDTPQAKPWRTFGRKTRAEKRAWSSAALAAFDVALIKSKRRAKMLRDERRRRVKMLAASGRGPEHPFASKLKIEEPLQDGDRRVLAYLIDAHNHLTGECYPRLEKIAKEIARSRDGVIDSLRRLKEYGFVRWVRRTKTKEGAEGEAGPQLEQTSNAFTFAWETSLTGRALLVFRHMLKLGLRRVSGAPPARIAAVITDLDLKAATEQFRASWHAQNPPPPDDSASG